MRTKLAILSFITLIGLVLNSNASSGSSMLSSDLTFVQVDALTIPVHTKQELTVSGAKFLFITRDYGSGLEIRDAYVYRRAGDGWTLVAYRRSSSASLTARVRGDKFEVLTKADKLILSLPTESLATKFDQEER